MRVRVQGEIRWPAVQNERRQSGISAGRERASALPIHEHDLDPAR
jgi:hypothetical protein